MKVHLQGGTDGLPWEAPKAAGAGPSGSGALQPYAPGGAAGGPMPGTARDRSGNAEITPLEVISAPLCTGHHSVAVNACAAC